MSSPQGGARLFLLSLSLAAAVGCGKSAKMKPDGGDGSVTIPDALAGARHAFEVGAALRATGGASGSGLPATNSFTLVLDADARLAIAGGNGRGTVVAVATDDGRTFRSTAPFTVGDPNPSACSGPSEIRYDQFEVTVAAGSLTGTATGAANISCGDCSFLVAFAATLGGVADTTPPTLHASGIVPSNPFDPISLSASEPLPSTATARLVADDGTAIDLLPTAVDGLIPLIVGFTKPDVVLRAGQGYVVELGGLVDFAGQATPADPPLRLTAFPAAPLVAEDGFESATGSTLGGAMVMNAGALPAISGNTSLYIGGPGAPGLDTSNGRSLAVKLTRQAGDTKLRFSYRVIAAQAQPLFQGSIQVGAEGGPAGTPRYGIGDQQNAMEMLTVAGKPVYASVAAQNEVPLPDGPSGDVLLVIQGLTVNCFPGGIPATGLLIDDLRLE